MLYCYPFLDQVRSSKRVVVGFGSCAPLPPCIRFGVFVWWRWRCWWRLVWRDHIWCSGGSSISNRSSKLCRRRRREERNKVVALQEIHVGRLPWSLLGQMSHGPSPFFPALSHCLPIPPPPPPRRPCPMLKKPWQKMKVCSHTHPQQFPCVLRPPAFC